MQDTTFEKYEEPAEAAPSRFQRIRGAVSTAIGAIVALSLLMALGVWFYRLGVRDAQNVPIIRASAEPAKVRPADPGGAVAPHQDVSSYEIAESTPATRSAAAAVIAPSPAVPQTEDVAMGTMPEKAADSSEDESAQPGSDPSARAGVSTASGSGQSSPGETSDEVASLIAAIQQEDAAPTPSTTSTGGQADESNSAETASKPSGAETSAAPEEEDAANSEIASGSDYAPSASPKAPTRPKDLRARLENAVVEAKQDETDLASRAANSSIQIQLAADPDEQAIRARWRRIFNANKDILRDKALAVQTTTSGGTTFYRLRVGPFESRSKAAAICQALKARGQDCIIARNS